MTNAVDLGSKATKQTNSVCASAQFDQSFGFTPGEMLDPWLPIAHPLKTLTKLCECAEGFKSSMGARANLYLLLDLAQ